MKWSVTNRAFRVGLSVFSLVLTLPAAAQDSLQHALVADTLQPAVVHDTVYRYVLMPVPIATSGTSASVQKAGRYEQIHSRRMRYWAKLLPDQATLQYAGSIGLLSIGPGWHYGRNDHWETDLLFGFLPRYQADHAKFTFTVKERYVPWHCRLSSCYVLQPLTAGFFFNTISSDDFWRKQPDKYPSNYYWFSTRIRTNIFLGQRIRYDIPSAYRRLHSSVSAYYEISTCDLYVLSKIHNREYPWRYVFSLAFGLKWEM